MKSSATAAVESSSTTVTSMLGKHRLRQPAERNHRDEDKNYSKWDHFLHITTLGSTSPQSLDDICSSKGSKAAFYTRAVRNIG
jgi:hypothetical protein